MEPIPLNMTAALRQTQYTDVVFYVFLACLSPSRPLRPYKKLIGFARFGNVTLKGSGGVRTPGPPRPATRLKRS